MRASSWLPMYPLSVESAISVSGLSSFAIISFAPKIVMIFVNEPVAK